MSLKNRKTGLNIMRVPQKMKYIVMFSRNIVAHSTIQSDQRALKLTLTVLAYLYNVLRKML